MCWRPSDARAGWRGSGLEIESNFKLVFDDGDDMQTLVKEKKALVKKLQTINPYAVKQEELMNHAEELGIDLMEDGNGQIIIMDTKDLTKFVNLLNDDYHESADECNGFGG